eukprot:NODE_3089_length_1052_cov_42.730808_g2837_i0.p1 GENE.NODE_3089_length_1052_cov_42.730808_g2837_i0~~NODE_3089_length_1052_cov_42.730808_g2837_i0.p1  ORF type:complete len:259 (-),score=34.90 NODE_3089_length_1052_cov_42.730808_g2837_i0:210-986(-)
MADSLHPDVIQYLNRHKIPDLLETILHELMVYLPEDPLQFLANYLGNPYGMRIMIAGPPASGKGTQCENIAKALGVVHISTGDLLRAEVKQGTPLGKEAEQFMSKGELVPDNLLINLVRKRLDAEDVRRTGWLLDGFPRTKAQALALQSAGILPQHFILIECPDAVVIERIVGRRTDPVTGRVYHTKFNPPTDPEVIARLEQRKDDTKESIQRRLKEYHRNVKEIAGCYRSVLRKVDGNQSMGAVWSSISSIVTPAKL